RIVDYNSATRLKNWKDGKNPFEIYVQKFGLPNPVRKDTTNQLKLIPITSYLRSINWNESSYYTFLGIRADEFDRISINKNKRILIYPLIEYIICTKIHINFW